jgi:hypothetical protein
MAAMVTSPIGPVPGDGSPRPKLRDERLCWLAVRDELRRGPGLNNPFRALARVFGTARSASPRRGRAAGRAAFRAAGRVEVRVEGQENLAKGKIRRYAFAVDDVAGRLSDEERRILRTTGKVPDWFLEAVRERYRELRRGGQ